MLLQQLILLEALENPRQTAHHLGAQRCQSTEHRQNNRNAANRLHCQDSAGRGMVPERSQSESVNQRGHSHCEAQRPGEVVQKLNVDRFENATEFGCPKSRRAVDDADDDEDVGAKALAREVHCFNC